MQPKIEPLIKLDPTIKLIGNFIDSFPKKFILLFFELFCIPKTNIENKQLLKIIVKIIFFNGNNI